MNNAFKTLLLLASLTGIILAISSFWGTQGLFIGLIFTIIMNFSSYFYSDKIVLKMHRAIKCENEKILNLVKGLAKKARLPLPKVYIIPANYSNAFATGRNPKHSAIALTQGIINLLDEKELESVIAHELGHIKNKDIMISSLAATLAGVISYVAMMARWSTFLGGPRDDNGPSIVELLAIAIITPLAASIIQFSISRTREFGADDRAKQWTGTGEYLINALKKIESSVKNVPMHYDNQSKSMAHMYIANPFNVKNISKWFSTHPSLDERIHNLRTRK